MRHRMRGKLTYANVVSTLCLTLAVGTGGAYAADAFIGSAEVKNDSLTTYDVKGKRGTAEAAGTNGALTGHDISGQAPIDASGQPYVNGSITTWDLTDDTIRSRDVKDDSIESTDVKDDSIESADVKDGTVKGADIQDHSVTGADILGASVESSDLEDGTVRIWDLDQTTKDFFVQSAYGGTHMEAKNEFGADVAEGGGAFIGSLRRGGISLGTLRLYCHEGSATIRYAASTTPVADQQHAFFDTGGSDARYDVLSPGDVIESASYTAAAPTADRVVVHVASDIQRAALTATILVSRRPADGADSCRYHASVAGQHHTG